MVSAKVAETKENHVISTAAAHLLVLPYPVQGHINPMLQFAKRLASRGLKVTLTTTVFISKHMEAHCSGVGLCTISDGYDGGGFFEARSPRAYHHRLEVVGSRSLAELIQNHTTSAHPFTCLVYDTSLHWALDVAKGLGMRGVAFSTQSCAAFAVYYYVYCRRPPVGSGLTVPGLPPLTVNDLPSLVVEVGSYLPLLALKLEQFSNLHGADFILFNSVEELESEVVSWMKGVWKVKVIGPTVPSRYLQGGACCADDDSDYGLNYYKNSGGAKHREWLDSKPVGSVVYVSFGSIATVGAEQMEECAWGLHATDKYFFWVVRPSEQEKLPREFSEKTRGKGLVVTWCCQLEVLAHEAVGCFVSHCGWNSVLEALTLGVPMVGVPLWTDQPMNAKHVEDVWGVGARARADEKGIVRREELQLCVKEALGRGGEEAKKNAAKWSKLIVEAASEGGSSCNNMEDFVQELLGGELGKHKFHI